MNKNRGVKSVSYYDAFFATGIIKNKNFSKVYPLSKNLSYSCQYLEHLDNALKNRDTIHVSVITEMIKTYVITGVSIIESILYYALKSKNLHKQNDFKAISKIHSNAQEVDGAIIKLETILLKKMPQPQEEEMSLDSMLKKVEAKKLLGADASVYKELNHLRKLRNKIHLYLIEQELDHDWNNFSDKEIDLIKGVLRKVIASSFFTCDPGYRNTLFDFL